VKVPVLGVVNETTEIKTFRMARPDGWAFDAGQFLTVCVQADGKSVKRAYSISSAPEATGYLEISVKRQGLVSGTLHATVKPGSVLTVRPPAGRFTYPKGDERPIVLLAGGVGITPLMSMLRHAVTADPTRPVTLLFSVRSEDDVVFRDELEVLARRHPQLRTAVAVSREAPQPKRYAGRIDEGLISGLVDDPPNSIFLICGPNSMIDAMKTLLSNMDVPDSQVRAEAFGAPSRKTTATRSRSAGPDEPAPSEALAHATELIRSRDERGAELAASPSAVLDAPPLTETPQDSITVTFARSAVEAVATEDNTLLETAEAHGVEITSSCRAGVCGTCVTCLLEGDVDSDADPPDPGDGPGVAVLPCVSRARGDCTLDA
jgi:ferredoxin-NADP reductase